MSSGTGHNELKFQPHIRSTNADIVLVRPSLPSLWSKFTKKNFKNSIWRYDHTGNTFQELV